MNEEELKNLDNYHRDEINPCVLCYWSCLARENDSTIKDCCIFGCENANEFRYKIEQYHHSCKNFKNNFSG